MQSQRQERNVVHNNTTSGTNNNWMSNNEVWEGKSSSGEFDENTSKKTYKQRYIEEHNNIVNKLNKSILSLHHQCFIIL
jgi:hypothetical protein